jgi:hypothetical protein
MKYATPALVVLGPASVLVLGGSPGRLDNGSSTNTRPPMGIALGLD